jgi:response regulator RpfG family c-di-GMP phosphodiesterase
LTEWGYEVISTKDGIEAWEVITTPGSPNLLIIDWMMPGMDGVEVCRRIRQLDDNVPKYVILLTSKSDEDSIVCGLEVGANDYVTKPFNHNELHARVKVGCRNVELESALANKVEKLELEIANRKRVEEALERSEAFLQKQVVEQTYEIKVTQKTSIEALATLAEYNDTDTGNHLKRIQEFVSLLATHLRDDSPYSSYFDGRPGYIDDLVLASLLHDIGKTAIPTSILTKPGKLTDEEFELMKKHTTVAGEMLEKANRLFADEFGKDSYLALARDIAYYHHEKWNGRGYPRGMSGESIPLSARIVATADVYDALISKRPYKGPWSHKDAAKEIEKESGQHFDPVVIDVFTALSDKFEVLSAYSCLFETIEQESGIHLAHGDQYSHPV